MKEKIDLSERAEARGASGEIYGFHALAWSSP
jgi:hypothetical protein